MSLIANIYNLYRKIKYVNSFIRATKNPIKAQRNFLLKILKRNKDTIFGKEHDFSSINTIKDFQDKVPIRDYNALQKYIEKIKSGQQGILTNDKVIFFSTTSGTTGTPKFCPITQESRELYTKNLQRWFYFACRDHPRIFDEYVLSIVSKAVRGNTKSGIPFGAISGLVYNSEPSFVKRFYAIPEEVFDIEDYDAKYYCILRLAIEKDINLIFTPNPSTILRLCELAIHYKDILIEDVENGTLSNEFKIDFRIRDSVIKGLKRNPSKALQLRLIATKHKFIPKYYWPNLRLIACWKEGTLGHYIHQLGRYFEDVPIRDIGLIASESYCSIPIADNQNAGVLTIDTNFYEFVDKNNKQFTIENLQQNKEYSLIITTSSGLYRYHLDDIAKVVGFYNKTPIIRFIHRGNNITSITGEKLTEWQVVTAIKHALEKYSIPLHHFTFYANGRKKGHYDIYLELYSKADKEILKLFLRETDKNLCVLNMEYKEKRRSGRLLSPKLKIVEEKTYHLMHRAKSIVHSNDSQIKLPVLTDKKTFKSALKVIDVIKL